MRKFMRTCGKLDPDLSRCRTSSVGATIPGTDREMYYCRIDNADCRYAMPLAFDYICKHPDSQAFAMPEDEGAEPPSINFMAAALG